MFDERMQRTSIAPDDWILGSSDVPVTVLEYGDFQCHHCAQTRTLLKGLVLESPELCRLVYRHFPVTTIHRHSALAAEAAEAAGAQGRFWEMHDALFVNQERLEYEDLHWYAEELALDVRRFEEQLAAHVHRDEVKRDFRRGIHDGVNGTPTLFVNGRRYDGHRDRGALFAAVAAELGEEPLDLGTF